MSRTLALLTPWIIAGCAVDGDSIANTDEARISPNGTSLNGVALTGHPGATLTGVAPTGVAANGVPIRMMTNGAPLSGKAFIGSKWTGHLSDGSSIALRVDAAVQGASSDVWSYRVAALVGSTWRPLCVDAAGNPGLADSVTGTWNYAEGVAGGGAYHPSSGDFTLACRGSAIAKCVELGYKPWTGDAKALAACTRAIRADFCGDGTSFTIDGTTINVYDVEGIVPDGVGWQAEAEWTASGASCVSGRDSTRFWQTVHETPACLGHALKVKSTCGSGELGTVITELPPPSVLDKLPTR